MALHPFALAENFSSENCQQMVIQCFSSLPYSHYEDKNNFHSHGIKQRSNMRCGVGLAWKTYECYAHTSPA